jgi:hypothetical protein
MRTIALGLNAAAVRLFLLAALLTAAWLGLNFSFPNLAPTGIPNTVIQIIINGIILIGLWRGLSRTDFTARTRVAVWLGIAVPLTLWATLVRQLAVQGIFFRPIPGVTRALPALAVAIFVPVVVGLVLLARSKRIAALLDVTPPSWLIGLQVYRVLGGAFLVNWGMVPFLAVLPCRLASATLRWVCWPCQPRSG